MADKDSYSFQILFQGSKNEDSFDVFEIANTILATSQAIQQFAAIQYGQKSAENIKIEIHAFQKGSLVTDFVIGVKEAGAFLIPLAPKAYDVGKELLSSLKTFIDVKKALKGNPPKGITHNQNGTVNIITGNNNQVFVLDPKSFRSLQDRNISMNIARAVAPLLNESSTLQKMDIDSKGENIISVDRTDANSLKEHMDLQTVSSITYKGVISKIDTKALSGFISIGSKRISFTYPENLPHEKFNVLVDSLRDQIMIYLSGAVTMDYESNPKSMEVVDIRPDENLF